MPEMVVENLVKRFGSVMAVDHVSFRVADGEFFFLLGPSGCGKTTLLRCIAGFLTPDEGKICVGGQDITREPPWRRNTAMVFQNYALWPHMTALENVCYGLELRGLPRAECDRQARQALSLVRMEELADRRPTQLSGGEQQRVALARALAVRPSVLLLDEPLSNLDAKLRLEMRQELRRIQAVTGVTTIYVTHDQKEALSMAHRTAVMVAGRVVQIGTPMEVYRRPASRFVAEFMGQSNLIPGRVTAVGELGAPARISTSLGELLALPTGELMAGQRVTLCIRPESLVPLAETCSSNVVAESNCFVARIEGAIYLGDAQECTLLAEPRDGGAPVTLRASIPNPRGEAGAVPFGGGQAHSVRFCVAPEDVMVLPE